MSYHGAVQSVFRHDTAPSPRLLRLSPLRSAVLEPYLESIHYIYSFVAIASNVLGETCNFFSSMQMVSSLIKVIEKQ